MEREPKKRKKERVPRQEWKPNFFLKLIYAAWMAVFSAFKIALGAVATVLLIVTVCGLVFVGILGDYLQNDILLESRSYELNISDLDQTSSVYALDSNGNIQLVQRIHTTVDRQWASIDEIPEDMINATIAIEDKRFYEHQGVDWITTVKACVNMFMGGSSQFGGSTITQQLIKNDTGENSVTVQRKVMEIFRAIHAEQKYNKDTIMEWYLNTIYLGSGCYGVKSAAAEYFGKELQSLTVAECASLISITNNPSLFSPYSSTLSYKGEITDGAQRNRSRQLNVLNQMLEQGMLTEEEHTAAVNQAIVFKSGIDLEDTWSVCENEACGYEGILGTYTAEGENYFCPVCGTQIEARTDASLDVYSYFVDTVIEDVAADLAAQDGVVWDALDKEGKDVYRLRIQRGGYNIYSTLDMDVQAAVDAVYTDLSQIPRTNSAQQLQSAIVVIDNETGYLVAMAGGVGEKTVHDGQNRATDSLLQTGSSQKPLTVYAPAFEVGAISPATVIKDMPISYAGGAFPKNDNRVYNYSRTIFDAVRLSVNAVAVNTLDRIGFDYSLSFAKNNLGISTLVESYTTSSGRVLTDLAYSPLGMGALTVGATVREMSAAYATFANDGVYREAITYTKVYDSEGNLVLDNEQNTFQAMSEKTVNYMNYCLYAGANNGTGTAAVFNGQNIAGKTGTTSSNKDRWFCGFTAHYTAAVWTGYDQPETINLGTNPACILWKKVMQPIHKGLPNGSLYDGSNFRSVNVCLDSGLLATDACSQDVRGIDRTSQTYCYAEDIPGGYCNKHVTVDYCVTGGGVATEYCHNFAEHEEVKIQEKSLVKLTRGEVDDINSAKGAGLSGSYYVDYYVYLVDADGDPLDWHGFTGKLNKGEEAPYLLCPEHTEKAWKEYEEELKRQEEEEKKEEEEATTPSDPTDTTSPAEP